MNIIILLKGKIALAIPQMFLSAYVTSHSFLTCPLLFYRLSFCCSKWILSHSYAFYSVSKPLFSLSGCNQLFSCSWGTKAGSTWAEIESDCVTCFKTLAIWGMCREARQFENNFETKLKLWLESREIFLILFFQKSTSNLMFSCFKSD